MAASNLFGELEIIDVAAGQSDYAHTFGGPPDREQAFPDHTHGIRLHLLHRFDLSDPLVPLSVPGLKWLPLYYVFDFRVNEVGYKLSSDSSMTTYFPSDDPNVSTEESWPSPDFPMEFTVHSVKVSTRLFDPSSLEESETWAGVFGIEHLNKKQRAKLRKRIEKHCKTFGMYPPSDDDLAEFLNSPFWQGPPKGTCLNPSCSNYRLSNTLNVFAIVPHDPIPGLEIWGGADVQIIFEICPLCHTIRSTNQCG